MENDPNGVSSKSIDLYDSEYYSSNKWMLSMFGQWPYQPPRERRIRAYCALFYSFSVLGPQVRPMTISIIDKKGLVIYQLSCGCGWRIRYLVDLTNWLLNSSKYSVKEARAMALSCRRLDTFSECFSPLGTHVCCVVKLLNFMLQREKLKSILDDTRRNWESTQNPAHISILKEYGMRGRIWSIGWFGLIYVILSVWVSLAMLPKVLDAILPLNESRKTFDAIPADYGVDKNEYWWWIQFHVWTCTFMFLAFMPAIDGFYVVCAQHICAMFEIARYNLENIIKDDEDVDVVLKPPIHEDVYYHEVVSCIRKHKLLMQYIRSMASTNESCLLFVVGLNMVGLSITGYQAVAEGTETDAAMRFGLFTFGLLFHLFVITLPGHWIMEASSVFPNSVYSCKWYMMSLRTKRLIILIIRASIEPSVITAGKIYVMSIENFCGVLQTSVSYLTMLTSMQ